MPFPTIVQFGLRATISPTGTPYTPFAIMLHFVPPAGKEGQRPGITRQELRGGREAIVAGARLVIECARVTCSCYCAINLVHVINIENAVRARGLF